MTLGTTMDAVAHALPRREGMKVVTNNTEVARILREKSDFEIVLTGGIVQKRNGGLVGQRALEAVAAYRCDFLLTGIGAVEPDGALLDYHDAEVVVIQAMRKNARHTLLACDHTKFTRTANQHVGHLRDLTALFTDADPGEAVSTICREAEAEIIVADP